MTQKELAGLLHVTDRAVSKWERGLCAPDISLLEPLAAALGVTVMELISGERLKREEYTDEIDLAVKNIITYSENEITQKTKALKKKGVCVHSFGMFGFAYPNSRSEWRYLGRGIFVGMYSCILVRPKGGRSNTGL